MFEEMKDRMARFQRSLRDTDVPVAVLTDESSIAYLAGFWGYLGVEFGRPTFLVVPADGPPTAVTPLMESEMVGNMTWVEDVHPWLDEGDDHWDAVLGRILARSKPWDTSRIGIEGPGIPAFVLRFLEGRFGEGRLHDIAPLLGGMRRIKSALEIEIMREAGAIGGAMMTAAQSNLREGVREYEVALTILDAGTRKAADFLTDRGWDAFVSPVLHNLQIMQSGQDTAMVHRRAGMKRVERGDPVYFCFCNLLEFKHYRMGFDRVFFIGEPDPESRRVEEVAMAAQRAALSAIRPGVPAENVAEAANAVYRENGFEPGYRTGRSIGMAYLESPELKIGDTTPLEPGMTFAVDGGLTVPGRVGGRIGDSIVVTDGGFEYLTEFPREILVVDP